MEDISQGKFTIHLEGQCKFQNQREENFASQGTINVLRVRVYFVIYIYKYK